MSETPVHVEADDELSRVTALLWSFAPYHVLRTAVQADIFEVLSCADGIPAEDVAHRLAWDTVPTRLLLDVLAAYGLIRLAGGRASATETARRWFTRGSPLFLGGYFRRLGVLEEAYQSLEDRMESGAAYPPLQAKTLAAFGLREGSNSDAPDGFCDILAATSAPIADAFFRVSAIPHDAAVLDVGAGSGVFTSTLLDLGHTGPVTILDTPSVCARAKRRFGGRESSISWLPVDWNEWTPDGRFDVVFLHHVLHEEKEPAARRLFQKCAATLSAGGHVHVIGLFPDGAVQALPRLFSMNVFIEIGGDNPGLAWLRSQAKEAQLVEQAVLPLPGGRTLWTAVRC